MPYRALADAVLVSHLLVVVFVVLGLPAIVVGNRLGWSWVNGFRWRLAHLVAIGVVALQAWLGQYCPLTVLETALRERAGQAGYDGGFIEHWVQRAIYFDAPLRVFSVVYTLYAVLIAWAWWRYRPVRAPGRRAA